MSLRRLMLIITLLVPFAALASPARVIRNTSLFRECLFRCPPGYLVEPYHIVSCTRDFAQCQKTRVMCLGTAQATFVGCRYRYEQ